MRHTSCHAGVVQFARSAVSADEFAIKFFLHRRAFERERDLYRNATLRAMMPATHAIIDNVLVDANTSSGKSAVLVKTTSRGRKDGMHGSRRHDAAEVTEVAHEEGEDVRAPNGMLWPPCASLADGCRDTCTAFLRCQCQLESCLHHVAGC